jgi:hypothetical protein
LADQQYKSSDTYQHRNQNTDNERNNPMPTLGRLRSSAFLRRSDTQPKEKVAHPHHQRAGGISGQLCTYGFLSSSA